MELKAYLLALGVGLLVGVIYSLFNVRSPAPPVIALVGLLGILVGEQLVPLAKRAIARQPISLAIIREHARDHMFGALPARRPARLQSSDTTARDRDGPR